jgi:hypothetical protein
MCVCVPIPNCSQWISYKNSCFNSHFSIRPAIWFSSQFLVPSWSFPIFYLGRLSLHLHCSYWSPSWQCFCNLNCSLWILLYVLMCQKTALKSEWPITNITVKQPFPSMHVPMHLKMTEQFITYITGKWPLLTMHVSLFLQITLLTERLIIYITANWAFPTMYALMSWDYPDNCRSALCMHWCVKSQPLRVNDLSETLQLSSHFPVCMCLCIFGWPLWLNDLLHTLQENGCSPLCMHLCHN